MIVSVRRLRIAGVLLGALLVTVGAHSGVLPQDGDARFELKFWESVKDSERPEDYEAYLEAFPEGRFVPLARARAKYLRQQQGKPQPIVPSPEATAPRHPVREMDAEYLVIRGAHLRKEPSAESTSLQLLPQGSRVRVTGQVVDKNWYRVETSIGGIGYISGRLVGKPPALPSRTEPPLTKRPLPPSKPEKGGRESQDCPKCPEMILLLPETFVMGEKNGHQSEKPAHRVAIRQPFAVGKYEVTVGEWNACVEEGRCPSKAEKSGNDPNAPVRDISWTEARQYAKWLSRKTGKPYRLPTEAEWEFAARGGTTTRYWWGDELISGKANCKNCGGEWDRKLPARVGSFSPNPFGLHDMNGSVWEWVADCWHGSYAGAPRDGSAWEEKDCRARVIRGGSWRNDSTYAHSASRLNYDADVSYLLHGFRVAKSVE